jgi:hypothetical protein
MAKSIDWERVEFDYRAGILTLREIGEAQGVSPAMILKRSKKYGWERDLSAQIQSKAEGKVARALAPESVVTVEDSPERQITEQMTVEVGATALAEVKLRHRATIKRSLEQATRLLEVLEDTDPAEDPREFAVLLRQLSDAQRTLIGMESEAWGLSKAQDAPPPPERIDPLEGARRIAFALHRAAQPVVH